ncbi:MAG TPA: ATP-binding cassette domain-containing protein [Polyangiaceae bacterium]|nr:ATP-binding cassette domain-containing protein [Polyangiaceae bacterium]
MLRICAEGLCFAFSDAAPLLESASFTLTSGFTGLSGANGAGKTTLLRLIQGELRATSGTLRVEPHGARVIRCEQEMHAVTSELRRFAESENRNARRLRGVLRLAELDRWDTLSSGERKRWQIAAALASEPEVLLLDEPTNHLDSLAREWLVRALSEFSGIGLVVSHDRALLNQLTSKTLCVQDGAAVLYSGGYDDAKATWQAEQQQVLERRRRVKQRVQGLTQMLHESRAAQRGATLQRSAGRRMKSRHDSDARSILATTKAEWAQTSHGRKVEVIRHELSNAERDLAGIRVEKELGSAVIARFSPAQSEFIAYRERAPIVRSGFPLIEATTLSVRREDRIWIRGGNGAGKTTLLNALLGALRIPEERVTFVPQELSAHAVREHLDAVRALPSDVRGNVLSVVAALGVDPGRLLASAAPSPGEGRKLAIAQALGRHVHALFLDEPTNHLDLPSIERLQVALESYPGALVLVTHDETLGHACTNTRWTVDERSVRFHEGALAPG